MEMIRLAAHLFILLGAVNTGVLTSGDKAILFDCCDTVTLERLAETGINRVDKIYELIRLTYIFKKIIRE